MRKATNSVDDEPCDYQKAGSSLVPGAVESDRDATCLGTSFFGGAVVNDTGLSSKVSVKYQRS